MLNCPFNSNPDFFSVQFCTFMLKFHPNMTHLTLPSPTSPHGFQSQSGFVTCLYAVNLRVKSGAMVPTWTGKPGKMRKLSSQGILNRLEKSGNFAQNAGKMRKFSTFSTNRSAHCSCLICTFSYH